eukprot:TRINITY_DN2182_c5_g1_i1.p1 TRINITY_DN2182_c5_g1~~TRINITY_DN2182_c5_g1_i1.p1  ORF type:complete len:1004 (-),score=289.35 TRINITY_DN2182_c5_g1_i1:54-2825(-)
MKKFSSPERGEFSLYIFGKDMRKVVFQLLEDDAQVSSLNELHDFIAEQAFSPEKQLVAFRFGKVNVTQHQSTPTKLSDVPLSTSTTFENATIQVITTTTTPTTTTTTTTTSIAQKNSGESDSKKEELIEKETEDGVSSSHSELSLGNGDNEGSVDTTDLVDTTTDTNDSSELGEQNLTDGTIDLNDFLQSMDKKGTDDEELSSSSLKNETLNSSPSSASSSLKNLDKLVEENNSNNSNNDNNNNNSNNVEMKASLPEDGNSLDSKVRKRLAAVGVGSTRSSIRISGEDVAVAASSSSSTSPGIAHQQQSSNENTPTKQTTDTNKLAQNDDQNGVVSSVIKSSVSFTNLVGGPSHGNFDGWQISNISKDYARLGLCESPWRITAVNTDFSLCDTYPASFIVPSDMGDNILPECASFRTRNRLPAIVWRHESGAVLVRCSQPATGLLNKRSPYDERYLDKIWELNKIGKILYIMDARPKVNAKANALIGGGFENTKFYKHSEIEFQNIENIHKVRESWRKMFQLITRSKMYSNSSVEKDKESDSLTKSNKGDGDRKDDKPTTQGSSSSSSSSNSSTATTLIPPHYPTQSELEGTAWFLHLKSILVGAARVRDIIQDTNSSIITHCSDGWDRTSQVIALSELMLDPFYRSLYGFAVLIEKEWCSFGHQFGLRGGHFKDMHNYTDDQRAPIFLQFIDCVYQLTLLYPSSFQFNEKLLIVIMDHVYSCMYGTFLSNCEKGRRDLGCKAETWSVWDLILCNSSLFENPNYVASTTNGTKSVLDYDMNRVDIKFWESYYMKWVKFNLPVIDLNNHKLIQDLSLGLYEGEEKETTTSLITTSVTTTTSTTASPSLSTSSLPNSPPTSPSPNTKRSQSNETSQNELTSNNTASPVKQKSTKKSLLQRIRAFSAVPLVGSNSNSSSNSSNSSN